MLEIYFIVVFFIFGTVFGSFYNVVGIRLPQDTFMEEQRSHCPTCHRTLKWYELIPIISYIIQKGKCRGCGEEISPLYPLIEFGTGVGFALSYIRFGMHPQVIFAIALVSCAMIVTVADIRHRKIPNAILVIFLPIIIGWRMLYPTSPWWSSVVGALVAFVLLAFIIYISKGGMGFGDLKYFVLLGYAFGWELFFLLFLLSTGYGTIISIYLMAKGKVTRKSRIPFGPFISMAALTVLFFGQPILRWYISLF
jgi:leader peptidase (prepilin peptidase)/N-methyltransferase